MIAILGSGFGLYGYLPALAGLAGRSVVMPFRYRALFEARRELLPFENNISWVENEEKALDLAECVVIALRPNDQPTKVQTCLNHPNIQRLILEKPLAVSEQEGTALLNLLVSTNRSFRIGYTFCATPWAERLRRSYKSDGNRWVKIKWRFMAHHFRYDKNNWKREQRDGGGPLRFYGIQALALFAELGYDRVVSSSLTTTRQSGEPDTWIATLDGTGLPVAKIVVETRVEDESFVVALGDRDFHTILMAGRGPFDEEPGVVGFADTDRRVPLLYDLFRTFDRTSETYYRVYFRTQELWRQAEVLCEMTA